MRLKTREKEYVRKMPIIHCTHGGHKCLKKFIVTRQDQPDICVACLCELKIEEAFPLVKLNGKIRL